uniref:Expansin-like EG45 domain-containing protein n=1 Tax=Biomphalaria glabrata TaxID=6526 RepID=A0A2C9KME2_BIOGL
MCKKKIQQVLESMSNDETQLQSDTADIVMMMEDKCCFLRECFVDLNYGTYYGQNSGGGACQYAGPLPRAATDPKIWALVAINRPQFLDSLTCGICLKIAFCLGSVDFALKGDGRWSISMQAVQCPVGGSTIQYAFQGSNPWYIKLQIRNARIPITKALVRRNNNWVTMQRSQDGFWILSDGQPMPDGPIGVRLTAANGYVMEDSIPRIDNSNVLEGQRRVQVPYDPSLPSA